MTPYEKPKSLDQSDGYLNDALSFELLDKEKPLFKQINEQKKVWF